MMLNCVVDNAGNTTSMTYDRLSRKTAMTDPDMGSWSYAYDNNGNLTSQTDARSQTITMTYDSMNRLTAKSGTGLSVTYTYDAYTAGSNYGRGKRTGMSDSSGTTSYKYDARGRQIEEKRYISSVYYYTYFAYDGADRVSTVTYPTGEVVTQAYNGRSLPNTLSGSTAGSLVTGTTYNNLGSVTQINLGNGLTTYYGYGGFSGTYDNPSGYYGRLYKIKTGTVQEVSYTWDAVGNLTQRATVYPTSATENFTYDFLDRLTGVSGAYTQSFTYNQIGNLTSMTTGGTTRTYTYDSTKPHAVDAISNPATSYTYDANGNMNVGTARTWNVENQLTSITKDGITTTCVYDGEGNRVKKTVGGTTTIYVNKYYQKTGNTVTTSYYLGNKLIAIKEGDTLRYVHQDSLTSTSVMTSSSGTLDSSINYLPFGTTRSGSVNTDKKFTGQRLDSTGLYYYNARYYDPTIGRFISPDIYVQDKYNPQSLNRYSYCINNPLKYVDPSGHFWDWVIDAVSIAFDVQQLCDDPSLENVGYLIADVVLGIIPVIPAGVGPAVRGISKSVQVIKGVDKVIEGVKIGSRTEKIVVRASEGFKSFDALKKSIGSAGEGKVWHHIVEKCQAEATRAGFDARLIHNPNNVIAIDKAMNDLINGYYSSTKERFTGGKTVRDWLNGQSYEFQYEFGIQVLKDFTVIE